MKAGHNQFEVFTQSLPHYFDSDGKLLTQSECLKRDNELGFKLVRIPMSSYAVFASIEPCGVGRIGRGSGGLGDASFVSSHPPRWSVSAPGSAVAARGRRSQRSSFQYAIGGPKRFHRS